MSNYTIRKANLSDALNLTVLKQQVWISTYAVDGIREEFSKYVSETFTPDSTTRIIENPNNIVLVAEKDNHLIGCTEINLLSLCPEQTYKNSPEVTVLYVLERFQGIGLGKELLNKCIDELGSLGYKSVWLTVYHQNLKAIKFYERNRFVNVGRTDFEMGGNKYPNEIMFYDFRFGSTNENP